ncbi:MAG: SPOR domain-containing protein [Betaproteobacteria bacterium]|nr:SPOR domain-containing protein [Betaproteobacteria bacterium]
MNRPEMRSRTPREHQSHSGGAMTLFKGILIGLVFGVVLSAITAIYITHMPNPFVKKVDSVDTSSDKPINDMPDVSKHGIINPTTVEGSNGNVGALLTPITPQPVVPNTPNTAPPSSATEGNQAVVPPGGVSTESSLTSPNQLVSKPPVSNTADQENAKKASDSHYYVQTGAFKEAREAEDQRANLALIGIDASVLPPGTSAEKLYRVRIGPLANMDEVKTLLSTLKSNGLTRSSVIKQ